MAEEPRPWMQEPGVAMKIDTRHLKNADCFAYGCEPVSVPLPTDAHADATRFRWLMAHSTYTDHGWRFPFLHAAHRGISLREAIDTAMAMAADVPQPKEEPPQ